MGALLDRPVVVHPGCGIEQVVRSILLQFVVSGSRPRMLFFLQVQLPNVLWIEKNITSATTKLLAAKPSA
jgi:hypothetical protein